MTSHTITPASAQYLAAGDAVFTFDNHRIGTVKATTGSDFQVHVRFGRDFWLSGALIKAIAEGRVTLYISRDSVAKYKI